MTQKSLAYDDPAYLAVLPMVLLGTGTGGAGITGASGQSNKFAAFTAMLVKSLTLSATTLGTSTVSSNTPLFYRITNNGTNAVSTVTATYTLVATGVPGPNGTAVTTAAYAINAVVGTGVSTSAATTNPLLQTSTSSPGVASYAIPMLPGDIGYIAKGTDATEIVAAMLETLIQPLANITA